MIEETPRRTIPLRKAVNFPVAAPQEEFGGIFGFGYLMDEEDQTELNAVADVKEDGWVKMVAVVDSGDNVMPKDALEFVPTKLEFSSDGETTLRLQVNGEKQGTHKFDLAASGPDAHRVSPTHRTVTVTVERPECTICLDAFKDGSIVCRTPCSHLFHRECIEEWLKHDTRCCLCRKEISG